MDEPETANGDRISARGEPNLERAIRQDRKEAQLTNRHRRELARKGKLLGWKQLIEYASIVQPDTIYAWHRKLVALKYTAKRKINTERQKRMAVIRQLCVKYATENLTWGYGRIQGALANVGYDISTTSVGNILREKGIIPAPERAKRGNWIQRFTNGSKVTTERVSVMNYRMNQKLLDSDF